MTELWESIYRSNKTMWGSEPVDSAISTAKLFKEKGLTNILIPGFGYGRNAIPFIENGCSITGIEISKTAIDKATKYFGNTINVYHGNVSDMPFDQKLYDGIFCYSVIHLLNETDRAKLITDCYNQLKRHGYMVFVAVSTNSVTYGDGKILSKNRFETKHGITLYHYDLEAVKKEFEAYGLIEAVEIDDPVKKIENQPILKFWLVVCSKH